MDDTSPLMKNADTKISPTRFRNNTSEGLQVGELQSTMNRVYSQEMDAPVYSNTNDSVEIEPNTEIFVNHKRLPDPKFSRLNP